MPPPRPQGHTKLIKMYQKLMALQSLPSTNSINSKSLFDISKGDVSLGRTYIKKFYRYCRYYDHNWMTFKDLHFLGLFRGHQRNDRYCDMGPLFSKLLLGLSPLPPPCPASYRSDRNASGVMNLLITSSRFRPHFLGTARSQHRIQFIWHQYERLTAHVISLCEFSFE